MAMPFQSTMVWCHSSSDYARVQTRSYSEIEMPWSVASSSAFISARSHGSAATLCRRGSIYLFFSSESN